MTIAEKIDLAKSNKTFTVLKEWLNFYWQQLLKKFLEI